MAKLTAKSVEKAKASDARREISDDLIPALRVVVSKSGSKSWAMRTRIAGKPAKLTLGSCSTFSLVQARSWAREQLLATKAGKDPRAEKRERIEAERWKKEATVSVAIEAWLQLDQAGNRTAAEVRRTVERFVLPAWGTRPLVDIRKRDVHELIASVHKDAPVRSNRLLAFVRRFLNWCVEVDRLQASPAAGVKRLTKETSRERVLDDAELVTIWHACEGLGVFGKAVRTLMLTGARRWEIFGAKRGELAEDALRLPAERSKVGQGRIIWLSASAGEIVASLPKHEEPDRFLFSYDGETPYTGWSRAKDRLDEAAAEITGRPLEPWRLHDLRRTLATGLQRLGERLEVVEAVLGHVSGSRAGVVGVYQRFKFEQEAKAAIDRWARHLQGLITPEAGNVVELAKRTG